MPTTIQSARPVGNNLLHTIVRVTYEDLIEGDTSETESLVTLPDNAEIDHVWLDLVEAFEDTETTVTNVTCKIGTSADDDAFVTATELLAGPAATGRKMARGVWRTGDGAALRAVFTATGGNFGDGSATLLDAGKVDIHVVYRVF